MKNKKEMYHIGLSKEDIMGARYAILPGDPGRVGKIASHLESPRKLKVNREYTSYLGKLNGNYVLVISTGMGGPSAAICIEELAQIGIDTVVRVGTCGAMQLDVNAGDVVIAQAAIRQEGTSKEYVPLEYPAVANIELVNALISSAKTLGQNYHVGVVQSKDSFYGQHSPERMPSSFELIPKWNAWIKAGCLASEMESAAIFIVSSILNIRAASVLLVVWNQEQEKRGIGQNTEFDTEEVIKTAIGSIKLLMRQ